MATLSTLVPTAYDSYTGTVPTTTTVGNIDNTVASYDSTYLAMGANSTGAVFYAFSDLPADFGSMLTLTYNMRYGITPVNGDTESLYIQIFESDKTTALTDEMLVVTRTATLAQTNQGNTSFTGVNTTANGYSL